MESFDMFLNGNFVALTPFANKYGVMTASGVSSIETKWQSALFQSGQCGAFVGVFLAGPITNRIGYRWCTILALCLMNATIFISFFVSLPLDSQARFFLPPITDSYFRPSLSRCSPSDKRLKVCHGVSSLRTRLPTPAKLCLWSSVVPAQLLYR